MRAAFEQFAAASAATSALGLGVVDELRSIVNTTLVDGSTRLFDGH